MARGRETPSTWLLAPGSWHSLRRPAKMRRRHRHEIHARIPPPGTAWMIPARPRGHSAGASIPDDHRPLARRALRIENPGTRRKLLDPRGDTAKILAWTCH